MPLTRSLRSALLAATMFTSLGSAGPARAQTADQRLSAIEAQIQALQGELARVRRELVTRDAQVRSAQQEASQARTEARRAQQVQVARPGPQPGGGAQMASSAGGSRASTPGQAPGGQASGGQASGGQGGSSQGGLGTGGGGPDAGQQNASTQGQGGNNLGKFQVGGVTVQLGGFIEAAGIFRSRNEVADVASNWNTGMPLPVSPLYHENELRGTARQSRLSLLVQGDPDRDTKLAAYYEMDFLGAAPTANSVETNSYTPRLRQAYATYERSDLGLHVLAGQSWSLATMGKVGITPRSENIPFTIDAQYVPGFTFTRQPQIRVVKDLDDGKVWLGASLESPQGLFYVGPNGAGTVGGASVNYQNPGGSNLASTTNYSDDIAPDLIVKAAFDPGWGHYEVFGLGRLLHDRVSVLGDGRSKTALAGGGGGGFIVPLVRDKLDFQGSVLVGAGIGRYGATQLPDATLSRSGAPTPLPSLQALAGLIGHPVPTVDLYGYVGGEGVERRSFAVAGKGYGYGSSLYSNAGCGTELSTLSCAGNTSSVVQGTLGGWWRFLKGNFGTMQVGASYSYTRRSIFKGAGGTPSTDDNIGLVSFRYLPFQ